VQVALRRIGRPDSLIFEWIDNPAGTVTDIDNNVYHSIQIGSQIWVGWHIPTDEEWTILITFLGGDSVAGEKMKEAGLLHWLWPNKGNTNISGFTALPGGIRGEDFDYFPYYAFFWSSSQNNPYSAWFRYLNNYDGIVNRGFDSMRAGLSVRCLKDKPI